MGIPDSLYEILRLHHFSLEPIQPVFHIKKSPMKLLQEYLPVVPRLFGGSLNNHGGPPIKTGELLASLPTQPPH
jgi:hypothetical protein